MRDIFTTILENNAFVEGSNACYNNKPRDTNPYPITSSRLREFWYRGWDKRFAETAEKKGWL